MKRFTTAVLLLTLLPALAWASGCGLITWAASSMERVGQYDRPGTSNVIHLWAAGGETESFQVIVRARHNSPLTGVIATVPAALDGPGASTIAASNVTLYREHYVYVPEGSYTYYQPTYPTPAWFPDGLIPSVDPDTKAPLAGTDTLVAFPFDLPAETNQAIWVDVFVPRGTAAGVYTGDIDIDATGDPSGGVSINLTVWGFDIPLKPDLKSSFGAATTFTLPMEKELLRNRLMPASLSDLGDEDALMDSLGLNNASIGQWTGLDNSCGTPTAAPDSATFQTLANSHVASLPRYDYSMDEIGSACITTNLTVIKAWAVNMHKAGINNLATIPPTVALDNDGAGAGRSCVDIWTMQPFQYNASAAATALAKGDSLWSYNTLYNYGGHPIDYEAPIWQMDRSAADWRMQPGFLNQKHKMTGLLYWKVNDWEKMGLFSWNNVDQYHVHNGGNHYPGEGVLVYPGSTVGLTGGVAPSMRLKWLRDGVDDFDYIKLLHAKGGADSTFADSVVTSVASSWSVWEKDPVKIQAARKLLGDRLNP